ncbi:MAG: CARDB domain-containing protein [Candidatus Micrarchaeia archaeon]
MNRHMLWIMVFLVLLSGVFASFSVSSITISPQQASPGQMGTVTLVVTNGDALNSVQGITIEIKSGSYISMTNQVVVGDLGPANSVTLTVPFSVSQDTPTGIYPIDLYIYGLSKAPSGSGTQTEYKRIVTTIKVVKQPVLQFSLASSQLNEVSSTAINIKNDGGTAKNVYVSIANNDIGFFNQDVVYAARIDKEASIPISLDARNANEGSQKLLLKVTYEDELGNTYTVMRELPITIKKESGDFVFTQTGTLVTGKESIVEISVKNEGDEAQDVRLSVLSGGVQLIGISEIQIGTLGRGESKTIRLPLLANVEPGTTSVKFDLKWIENGQSREGTKNVPLKVSSDADVGVYLEAKPTPLYADSEHTISVTVSNLGSYPIKATTVELEGDGFILQSIQPEQYIGGLSKDDFSSVQYKVKTPATAGTYPLKITVSYSDASGEYKKKVVTINAEVKPATVNGKEGVDITVLIAVVIAGIAAYWLLLRPKGNKK